MRTREFLLKVPIFKQLNSETFLKDLAAYLEHQIFLPDDYIIYKVILK